VWTLGQLRDLAGDEAEELGRLLGVSAAPNFRDHHGKVSGSVVTRRADDPQGLFAKYRPALCEARAQRLAPARDDKVVTAWNGLAISALAKGYLMYGDERYREGAERCAEFLLSRHLDKGEGVLLRTSTEGVPGAAGVVEDYLFLANGLLDLFEATGAQRWERDSAGLLGLAKGTFAHPEAGLYQDAAGSATPFQRRQSISDTVEPSGNSVYLRALLKSGLMTGRNQRHTDVGTTLEAFAGEIAGSVLEMTNWLTAAGLWLGPYYLVVIAGNEDEADTRSLLAAWREAPVLNSVVLRVAADGLHADLQAAWPILAGKTALGGRATAYVCTHGTCSAPVHDPAALRELLLAR
jgi:uncharacterized protein YyaL (SSP411 family)